MIPSSRDVHEESSCAPKPENDNGELKPAQYQRSITVGVQEDAALEAHLWKRCPQLVESFEE